jgi:hypothetical protein
VTNCYLKTVTFSHAFPLFIVMRALLLGGEIEHVAGTTLESRRRDLMIESLEETVQLPLFGHVKRTK